MSSGESSVDMLFDALTHRQRRRLLIALLQHGPQEAVPVELDETAISDDGGDRSRVASYHTLPPKLDDYGLITWDRERTEVTGGPQFEEIEPVLESLQNRSDDLPDDWV